MISLPQIPEARRGIERNPRWEAVRYFIDQEPVVSSKNVGLSLYAQAYMWFHKLALFRQGEMILMYKNKPKKVHRAQHREIIADLQEEGRKLVRRIHGNGGMVGAQNGFSVADIEAAVEELDNTRLQWYGGMSKKRKQEILDKVFNAPQS